MVERIRLLLRAMGFWTWGLLAIALAAGISNMGYRLVTQYRLIVASVRSSADDLDRLSASASDTLAHAERKPRPTPASKSVRDNGSWYRERLDAANQDHNLRAQIAAGKDLFQAGYATPADKDELVTRIIQVEGCSRGFSWAELAIASETSIGHRAPQGLYDSRVQCAAVIDGHKDAYAEALKSDWSAYLVALMQSQDRHSELNLYRLMSLTDEPPDSMAKYAADLYSRGYYAEAAVAYEKAYELLGTETLGRDRDIAQARATAQASELNELAAPGQHEGWRAGRMPRRCSGRC